MDTQEVFKTIERIIATNSNVVVNPGRIGSINLCPNSPQYPETSEVDNLDITENLVLEEKLNKAKLETVPRLAQLGLTAEQISQALGLDLQLILESLKE